jgi:hypothetical protein
VAADVTYIPMGCGFLYLVAIIDWASRAFQSMFGSEGIQLALTDPPPRPVQTQLAGARDAL